MSEACSSHLANPHCIHVFRSAKIHLHIGMFKFLPSRWNRRTSQVLEVRNPAAGLPVTIDSSRTYLTGRQYLQRGKKRGDVNAKDHENTSTGRSVHPGLPMPISHAPTVHTYHHRLSIFSAILIGLTNWKDGMHMCPLCCKTLVDVHFISVSIVLS